MTTDETIAEVTAAGFLVNNLFQCNTRQWQANLRAPAGNTQFYIANTPAEALEGCLTLLNDLVPAIEGTRPHTIAGPLSLSALGLTRAAAPINRRA